VKIMPAMLLLLLVAACGEESDALPPFEEIKTAVLAYANCINDAAQNPELQNGSVESGVDSVRRTCSSEREAALNKKAVPVFAKSVEEFDEIHDGLARTLVEDKAGEGTP